MSNSSTNILLAEDNQDDATLFRIALRKTNVPAKLQIISNGEEAIEYLKGEGKYADRTIFPIPDFLVLDLNMPRRNGFEVLEWIRAGEIHKDLIVHVLSASNRDEDICRATELGANSYRMKPSRLSDLVILIQNLVLPNEISPSKGILYG